MPDYVILPDDVAKALELTVKDVDSGHPTIKVGAKDYEVWGIIDSQRLNTHTGMDGEKILPYDLNTVQTVGRSSDGTTFVVPEKIGRMSADRVIIASAAPAIDTNTQQNIAVACSILFPSAELPACAPINRRWRPLP